MKLKWKILITSTLLVVAVILVMGSRITVATSSSYYCHKTLAIKTDKTSWFGLQSSSKIDNDQYLRRLEKLGLLSAPVWRGCSGTRHTILTYMCGDGGPPEELSKLRPMIFEFALAATDDEVKKYYNNGGINSPTAHARLLALMSKHK